MFSLLVQFILKYFTIKSMLISTSMAGYFRPYSSGYNRYWQTSYLFLFGLFSFQPKSKKGRFSLSTKTLKILKWPKRNIYCFGRKASRPCLTQSRVEKRGLKLLLQGRPLGGASG